VREVYRRGIAAYRSNWMSSEALPSKTQDVPATAPETAPYSQRLFASARQAFAVLVDAFDPVKLRPRLTRAREVLEFAARRAREVRVPQVAGSLTFTTVLALVPLLAVALSIFATFPMFSEFRAALEKNLLRELLPPQHASTLLRYLNDFAAKAARLTAFGLGFLVVAAMLMIATVDRTLNDLWQVRAKRPLMQRVLVYWVLITLGPVLIGASLAASSYLLSMSAEVVQQLPRGLRALLDYLPVIVSAVAYAALFVVVPNRKVEWKDALIGGSLAAVLGEVIKEGFAAYIRGGVVTNIYGAFAVVPLFLIWVYLSWLILLLGAAVASTIPILRTTRFADTVRPGDDFLTAVALLRVLHDAALAPDADGERSADQLSRITRTPLADTERLLGVLEQLNYVRPLGGEHLGRWRLTCDPARTSLRALYEKLALSPEHSLLTRDAVGLAPWIAPLAQADALDRPLSQLSVRT
jgi:membrane protein